MSTLNNLHKTNIQSAFSHLLEDIIEGEGSTFDYRLETLQELLDDSFNDQNAPFSEHPSAKEIQEVLRHPFPQNRTTSYPYIDNPNPEDICIYSKVVQPNDIKDIYITNQGKLEKIELTDGTIFNAGEIVNSAAIIRYHQESHIPKSELIIFAKEPTGKLSLNTHGKTSKEEVIIFFKEIVREHIKKLQSIIAQKKQTYAKFLEQAERFFNIIAKLDDPLPLIIYIQQKIKTPEFFITAIIALIKKEVDSVEIIHSGLLANFLDQNISDIETLKNTYQQLKEIVMNTDIETSSREKVLGLIESASEYTVPSPQGYKTTKLTGENNNTKALTQLETRQNNEIANYSKKTKKEIIATLIICFQFNISAKQTAIILSDKFQEISIREAIVSALDTALDKENTKFSYISYLLEIFPDKRYDRIYTESFAVANKLFDKFIDELAKRDSQQQEQLMSSQSFSVFLRLVPTVGGYITTDAVLATPNLKNIFFKKYLQHFFLHYSQREKEGSIFSHSKDSSPNTPDTVLSRIYSTTNIQAIVDYITTITEYQQIRNIMQHEYLITRFEAMAIPQMMKWISSANQLLTITASFNTEQQQMLFTEENLLKVTKLLTNPREKNVFRAMLATQLLKSNFDLVIENTTENNKNKDIEQSTSSSPVTGQTNNADRHEQNNSASTSALTTNAGQLFPPSYNTHEDCENSNQKEKIKRKRKREERETEATGEKTKKAALLCSAVFQ